MRAFTRVCVIVFAAVVAVPVAAQNQLAKIDDIGPFEVLVSGFVLSKEQRVSVEAVGFRDRGGDFDTGQAWILNAETRDVVWTLADAEADRLSRYLSEFKDDVRLEKGRYEVYYSSFPNWEGNWEYDGVGDFISDMIKGKYRKDYDYDRYREEFDALEMVVTGEGKPLTQKDIEAFHNTLTKGAIIAKTGLKDEVYETIGLTLDRKMELEIYAVGELGDEGLYDTSWIIDTKTREKVWEFDYWDSEPAGGAKKNRLFKDRITLDKGSYAVFVATDDSHSFHRWNSAPPFDPYFWGVTIQAADPAMTKYAKVTEYQDIDSDKVVVTLAPLRDDEFESKGFTVKKPTTLRLYAIGEGKGSKEYDYSWIVDADTRDVVWKFETRHSEHAGGAKKNRVVDEVVKFEKGNYIAYAVTDDSHSYRHWNSAAPHDQKHWGLTIEVMEGSARDIVAYEEEEDGSVLVRMVGMGDNERERERFRLSKKTEVRIYAIGEGTRGDMYDFAWIENEDGRVVWEMTYRMTEHAGGAKKNRMYNDTVTLDAGEYTVFYESDGSHSFNRWNASPPADMRSWGVTVKLAEGR